MLGCHWQLSFLKIVIALITGKKLEKEKLLDLILIKKEYMDLEIFMTIQTNFQKKN